MIIKYFCDCGKELNFDQFEYDDYPKTIFCGCGSKYDKGFCEECGHFHVDQMYVAPKETMQQQKDGQHHNVVI